MKSPTGGESPRVLKGQNRWNSGADGESPDGRRNTLNVLMNRTPRRRLFLFMDIEGLMKRAIKLALRAKGKTSPNPLVGAVIYKRGKIVGEGYHKAAGKPHAEIEALKNAGKRAKGGILFVNLEPCIHYGRTPPCAPEIVKAGIKEVYIGMVDPNPKVNGKGIRYLLNHGVKVHTGILEEKAREINRFYAFAVKNKIPYVILKIASTLDGFIGGFSRRYITCEESRRLVHRWRNQVDGVLVGIGTVLKDNPELNVRLVKPVKQPLKIVLDTNLRIPHSSKLFSTEGNVIVYSRRSGKLPSGEVVTVGTKKGMLKIEDVLKNLYSRGVNSLLVEGGRNVFSTFIKEGFFQEIKIFYAPILQGNGIKMIENVSMVVQVERSRKIGDDILVEGRNVHRNN